MHPDVPSEDLRASTNAVARNGPELRLNFSERMVQGPTAYCFDGKELRLTFSERMAPILDKICINQLELRLTFSERMAPKLDFEFLVQILPILLTEVSSFCSLAGVPLLFPDWLLHSAHGTAATAQICPGVVQGMDVSHLSKTLILSQHIAAIARSGLR